MVVTSDNFFQQCISVCMYGTEAKDSAVLIYISLVYISLESC
jgi:hypothetical protein